MRTQAKSNSGAKTKKPAAASRNPKRKEYPKSPKTTIGIDLGDRKHAVCVLDRSGEVISELTIANTRESLAGLAAEYPKARVVIEVGSHSPWVSRHLSGLGLEVILANPRKMRAIFQNDRKSDEADAEILARIGRADPRLLYPVEHIGEREQRDL